MESINTLLPLILVVAAFLAPALVMALVCLVKAYNKKPLSHNLKSGSLLLSMLLACIAFGFSIRSFELGDIGGFTFAFIFFLPLFINIIALVLPYWDKYRRDDILDN